MSLNEGNYFSREANQQYMSASQLKQFMQCEAMAVAEITGQYTREKSQALLVGGYVDAHFSQTLDLYVAQNPEIYTQKGTLRAEYSQAQDIIAYIESDPLLMAMLSGATQEIYTGEIEGVPFKAKLDVLLTAKQCEDVAHQFPSLAEDLLMAEGAIVDMKIMKDMAPIWKEGAGKVSFVVGWQYDLQMAVYQEIILQRSGHKMPCYIACATKEKVPDKALIKLPQYMMDAALDAAREYIPRYQCLKTHPEKAEGCEQCAWCRQTKRLTGAIDADVYWQGGESKYDIPEPARKRTITAEILARGQQIDALIKKYNMTREDYTVIVSATKAKSPADMTADEFSEHLALVQQRFESAK